ncbi:MAG: DUF2851 family protein [Sediminibacterium sp.]|nr:DUF2851 family protein [Sediminibacterium sp.]MBX9781129.1 DUF2851 family protein [Chitinophagaceae bacterium]
MQEQLLHFIWQHRYFAKGVLETTTGESLQIIKAGNLNTNQGPDFTAAEIIIGAITLVGNIEIHIKASDWYKHKHQYDPLYQPIILHVVWENNCIVKTVHGIPIPCLDISPHVSKIMLTDFSHMMLKRRGLPCSGLMGKVKPLIWESWLERLVIERLTKKAVELRKQLDLCKGDWNRLALSQLAYQMGGKMNGASFDAAINLLSYQQVVRLSYNPTDLNAWLMGHLNLLPIHPKDEYPQMLVTSFHFLQKKYPIKYTIQPASFLRMRPAAFPTIRISQLVAWLAENKAVFQVLTGIRNRADGNKVLQMQANAYWDTHFCFDQNAPYLMKKVGQMQKDLLMINLVAPLLFTYGWLNDKPIWQQRAISLLQELPPETNHILFPWKRTNAPQQYAFHTQGLLELEKYYCTVKKCLSCSIGNAILQS